MMTHLSLHSRKVTAGQVVPAYEPWDKRDHGYETGSTYNGCIYHKCTNGYALWVTNQNCKQGYANKGMMHSGYPECPHGTATGMTDWFAHCCKDSGWDKVGYRAPCGRTTHKTSDDIYGYVTRTRTTSYTEETVPGEHAYKEVSRGRISSLWIQCAHSAEYRGYTTYPWGN